MDTAMGTICISHEECSNRIDETAERGQWDKLFTEVRNSWYFNVIKLNEIAVPFL
jgi:hypothetical protein